MFENKTYDNIMREMLEDTPNGLSNEEGSLLYNACAKQAAALEEAYIKLEYIFDNMLPDGQEEEILIRYAKTEGIERKEATKAVVKAVFKQEIAIGERFFLNGLTYTVTEKIENFTYRMQCETAGEAANVQFGHLIPMEFIDNFIDGEIAEILIPGKEKEDIEDMRIRLFKSFQTKAFAGNRAAYIEHVKSITGVGAVKVKRRVKGDDFIHITIATEDVDIPSTELVKEVQNKIDPEQCHGEGEGLAPMDHKVKIHAIEGVKIQIGINALYEEGYTFADIKSSIEAEIDSYFRELAQEWEESSFLTVRVMQINTRLLHVHGILDIQQTKLNEKTENIVLGENQIPKRGEIYVL